MLKISVCDTKQVGRRGRSAAQHINVIREALLSEQPWDRFLISANATLAALHSAGK